MNDVVLSVGSLRLTCVLQSGRCVAALGVSTSTISAGSMKASCRPTRSPAATAGCAPTCSVCP